MKFDAILRDIAKYVMAGLPLNRLEYHLAIDAGYLMGERPYEEFFKNHWHETSTHRGYGGMEICEICERESCATQSGVADGKKEVSAG